MQQYNDLKGQLVAATAVLVGMGSALAYAAGGRDLALPFALGGTSGVLYQYMLQVAADSVGGGGSSPYGQQQSRGGGGGGGPGLALRLALSNSAVRIALAAGGLIGVFALLELASGGDPEVCDHVCCLSWPALHVAAVHAASGALSGPGAEAHTFMPAC